MANEFKIKKGLIVNGSGGTLLDVQGSVGQVFSVTDSLTGDIFSVSDVSGIPIFNVNSDGTVTIDGNIQLADNDKIQLGDDQDLELYHDGTHSYISDNGTGELRFIANGATRFKIGSDVASFSGTDFAIAAARKLYLDGQSNTYITESSSDTIKIFTGGSEVLELADNDATFAGRVYVGENFIMTGSSPTISFLDSDSNADDFYIHINSNNFYVLTNRTDSPADQVDTGWETPHPLQLEADTNTGYLFGDKIFDEGYHPNADKWTTTRTLSLTGEVTGSVSWDGSGNASLATTINNGSLDDQYVTVGSRHSGDGSELSASSKASIRIWDVSEASDDPTGASDGLVLTAGWDSDNWAVQQYHDFHSNDLYLRSKQSGTWMTTWDRVFHDTYHPNADKWTSARTITLGGDLSGSVSIDGSANVTLTAAVSNNSHTHDGRYYTETESNAKFLTKDGSAKEWVFEVDDESNFTGNKWYKVATVNKGNGGLHIRGLFANHVEGFAAQKVDIGMVGREGGANETLEVTGQVDVLHRSATGTDNCGIRIVEADITSSAYYHYFDVWVKTTRYQMLRLHLTKSGNTTFHLSAGSNAVTTEPAPVSGGTTGVEIDTSIYLEGNYTISNSVPILTAKTTGTSVVGSLTAAADVIAYSDAKLKENVKTLDGSKVLQMRGVSFDRKDTGISSSGVIAQEMQQVAPELVSDDNGTLGVAYGNLTGYLIEAIKEQQKQIHELKLQMAACNKTACNCNCNCNCNCKN